METVGIEPTQRSRRGSDLFGWENWSTMEGFDHWLYRAFDGDGELLYIGITSYGMSRFRDHGKTSAWWPKVESFKVEHFATRAEVLEAETMAIRRERPIYNIVHNYPARAFRPTDPLPPAPVLAWGEVDATGRPRYPSDPHLDRWVQRAHPDRVDEWVVAEVIEKGSSFTVAFDHPCDAIGRFESNGFHGVAPEDVAEVALADHKANMADLLGVPQPA